MHSTEKLGVRKENQFRREKTMQENGLSTRDAWELEPVLSNVVHFTS